MSGLQYPESVNKLPILLIRYQVLGRPGLVAVYGDCLLEHFTLSFQQLLAHICLIMHHLNVVQAWHVLWVSSQYGLVCYVSGRVPNGKFGSTAGLGSTSSLGAKSPVMSKLESIASSAVRAADKVHASLIIVYTHTGETACDACLLLLLVCLLG